MVLLQGIGVSGGIAAGRLSFFHRQSDEIPRYRTADSEDEWRRFTVARGKAVQQIQELAELTRGQLRDGSEEAAQILEAHGIMAMDPEYEEDVGRRIRREHINAEAAVMDAAGEAAARIAVSDDSYMRARAADVEDMAHRIVAFLGQPEAPLEEPSLSDVPVILAADDLAPSETLRLDRTKILGFITAGGSAAGHTAILARTMGIPAVIGTGRQMKPEYGGQEILMDGDTGEIVIAPDEETRIRFLKKADKQRQDTENLEELKGKKTVTKDGRFIRLCCNISFPADVSAVLDSGADGIGLFRSECLFLGRKSAPSEEEQLEAYGGCSLSWGIARSLSARLMWDQISRQIIWGLTRRQIRPWETGGSASASAGRNCLRFNFGRWPVLQRAVTLVLCFLW